VPVPVPVPVPQAPRAGSDFPVAPPATADTATATLVATAPIATAPTATATTSQAITERAALGGLPVQPTVAAGVAHPSAAVPGGIRPAALHQGTGSTAGSGKAREQSPDTPSPVTPPAQPLAPTPLTPTPQVPSQPVVPSLPPPAPGTSSVSGGTGTATGQNGGPSLALVTLSGSETGTALVQDALQRADDVGRITGSPDDPASTPD
jgi:hypothetical protein